MLFATTGQAVVFLTTMYAGLIIGLCYDVLRAVRWVSRAGKGATAAADILFSFAAMCVFLYVLINANGGRPYGYTIMGAICGVALYMAGVSPLALPAFRKAGGLIRRVFLALMRTKLIKKNTSINICLAGLGPNVTKIE